MVEHRNTTVTVRVVLQACEALGVDTGKLLNLAGIERSVAENPDGEVSFTQMREFWKNAFQLSGDPFLGMHAAQYVKVGDYKCVDYLTINAATLGESMENFCSYMRLMNTWIGWEIEHQANAVTLRMIPKAGVIPAHSYEFVFAMYLRRCRDISSEGFNPLEVRFPFSAPENNQPHLHFFRCPVKYDAAAGEFVIAMDEWNKSLPGSDQQLMQILDEHARLLLSQRALPDDFVGKVRKEIVRILHGGEALRENIAARLNMSPRTLQRRLEENGVAYAELLDEVRADLAKNKLGATDLSLAEIGFLLGFSEQSSFNRAFKRWTGKTPLEYRRDGV